MEYRVVWEIDVDGETPADAALEAFRIMTAEKTSPDSATVFRVIDGTGTETTIDVAWVEK